MEQFGGHPCKPPHLATCLWLRSIKKLRQCSGLVPWDDPEGWDGEGGRKVVRDGDTCKSMAESCQCMAKTTTIL